MLLFSVEPERNGVTDASECCTVTARAMGCTTSVILSEGLRSAFERNCGNWKSTSATEQHGPAEMEAACSTFRESR
ncbi:putative dedicator of cytokinesis protein 9, partial [Clarias magur]